MKKMTRIFALLLAALLLAALCGCGPKEPAESSGAESRPDGRPFAVIEMKDLGRIEMHGDADWLDGQYAAFGKVTSGMEVVDAIAENTPYGFNGAVAAKDQPVIARVTIEYR